ncbi:MAG: hypothetical protein ACLVAU_13230 [Ruminococcus sp.]
MMIKEREWTEIPCDNAHIVELGKIETTHISSDGHSRTRWDNKRKRFIEVEKCGHKGKFNRLHG